MKTSYLKYLRRLVALVIGILCVVAFSGKFYELKIFNLQITALLQNTLVNTTTSLFIILAFVLGITFVFGRIYCSTLCPLGLLQELLEFIFSPIKKVLKKNKPLLQNHYRFSYLLAAVCFGSLLGGTVIIFRHFDPYSVFGNAMSGGIYGIAFIIVLAVLVFFKNRFFCTNICPVGAILGFISRYSFFKIRINKHICTGCAMCARKCPTGSIDFKNGFVNNETCIKCFNCLGGCKHKALTYSLEKNNDTAFDMQRREFLLKGGSFILLAMIFKSGIIYAKGVKQKFKDMILPAGARNAKDFANRCLNCNLCVKNCPMKIIKKANKNFPVVHLDYTKSHCDYNCNRCSAVCPSGALKRLTLEQKRQTKLGTAIIDTQICVKCGLCALECPKKVISKKAGEFPIVSKKDCIGCGACQNVCPVGAIKVKPVANQRNV